MRPTPRLLIGAFLLPVLAAPATMAQKEIVTLRNGAMFEGRPVWQDERWLELELPQGRIRLSRRWIRSRERPGGRGRRAPTPPSPRPGDEGGAPLAREPARDPLLIGALAISPVGDRVRKDARTVSSSETARAFCRLLAAGKGPEALEQLADPEAVLQNGFPLHAKGVTSYSRRMAARLLMRALMTILERPGVATTFRNTRWSVRVLPGASRFDLVEVVLRRPRREDEHALLGVFQGRVVDLSLGPAPLPALFRRVLADLAARGNKPWKLVPVLQAAAEQELGLSAVPGRAAPAGRRPVEGFFPRGRARRYVLALPAAAWEPVDAAALPARTDLALRSRDGRSRLLVQSEPLQVPLEELRRCSLLNVGRVAAGLTATAGEPVEVDGVPALRLHVKANVFGTPLTFELVLFVARGRAYQLALWARTRDAAGLAGQIEKIIAAFRLLS